MTATKAGVGGVRPPLYWGSLRLSAKWGPLALRGGVELRGQTLLLL